MQIARAAKVNSLRHEVSTTRIKKEAAFTDSLHQLLEKVLLLSKVAARGLMQLFIP